MVAYISHNVPHHVFVSPRQFLREMSASLSAKCSTMFTSWLAMGLKILKGYSNTSFQQNYFLKEKEAAKAEMSCLLVPSMSQAPKSVWLKTIS